MIVFEKEIDSYGDLGISANSVPSSTQSSYVYTDRLKFCMSSRDNRSISLKEISTRARGESRGLGVGTDKKILATANAFRQRIQKHLVCARRSNFSSWFPCKPARTGAIGMFSVLIKRQIVCVFKYELQIVCVFKYELGYYTQIVNMSPCTHATPWSQFLGCVWL